MTEEQARRIIRHHLIGFGGGVRINAAIADRWINEIIPPDKIASIANHLQNGGQLFKDGGQFFMDWKRSLQMEHANDEALDVDADQIPDVPVNNNNNNNNNNKNQNVWKIIQDLANAKNQNERFKAMAQLKGLGIQNWGQILGNNQPLANALLGPRPMGGWTPYIDPMAQFAGNFMTQGFLNTLPNMVNQLNKSIWETMQHNVAQRNFLRQGQFAEKRWNDYMALMRDMMGNKLELGKGYLAALPDLSLIHISEPTRPY